MNGISEHGENSLRDKIRKIQQDSLLSAQEKQEKIQETLSQQFTQTNNVQIAQINDTKTKCEYYPERKCKLFCVTCNEYVHCRFCHNDVKDHKFDRHNVPFVKCDECETVQSPSKNCSECYIEFSNYFCNKCHLYCESPDVFHCEGCRICRKGSQETYQHCYKCNMCIAVDSLNNHTCLQSTFEGNCAICNESLFDVIQYGSLLKCGHAIHQNCMQQYITSNYRCPLCKKSMVDMTQAWTELSERYKDALLIRDHNKNVERYCNDCCELFSDAFSPFMLYRCPRCLGYNNC